MNAVYSKTRRKYLSYDGLLRYENRAMCEWINKIPIKKWVQHANEEWRFGHIMMNLSECIDVVLKGARNLPIATLMKSTYFRFVALFVKKGREAKAQLASRQVFS